MNILKKLIGIALLSLLAACGGSPKGMVEDFYKSVEAGETTKAMGMLSMQVRGMMGEAKVKAMLEGQSQKIQQKGGIAKITIEGEPKAEVAFLDVVISYKNGEQEKDKVKLVKEDGDWKIGSR